MIKVYQTRNKSAVHNDQFFSSIPKWVHALLGLYYEVDVRVYPGFNTFKESIDCYEVLFTVYIFAWQNRKKPPSVSITNGQSE